MWLFFSLSHTLHCLFLSLCHRLWLPLEIRRQQLCINHCRYIFDIQSSWLLLHSQLTRSLQLLILFLFLILNLCLLILRFSWLSRISLVHLTWIFLLHFVRVNDILPILFKFYFLWSSYPIVLSVCHVYILIPIPNSHHDAVMYPKWKQAMDEKMDLSSHVKFEILCLLPLDFPLSIVAGFTVEYCSDGMVDR